MSYGYYPLSSVNTVGLHYCVGKKIDEGSLGVIYDGTANMSVND
jgi:hypothetical protein